MMKKLIAVCVIASLLIGCSGTYVAKVNRSDIFVTRGDTTKAYTPLALIEAERLNFYFLGIPVLKIASPEAEDQLNDIVNKALIPKARALKADGLICVEHDTRVPYFPMSFYWEEAKGIAIKFK